MSNGAEAECCGAAMAEVGSAERGREAEHLQRVVV